MKNTFVQFANLLHRFYAEQPAEYVAMDALLAYVCEANQMDVPVRVTDLVRLERFGTLPTLNRRLKNMTARGLVEMVVGDDRRTRLIRVSPAGEAMLDNRASLLREAAASEVRRGENQPLQ